jgi:hypothetical protein
VEQPQCLVVVNTGRKVDETATLGSTLAVSYRIKHTLIWPTLRDWSKRIKAYVYTKTYKKVHCNFIHNGPKLEPTPISISWRVDKQIVVCLCTGIQLNNKVTIICLNLKNLMLNKRNETQKITYWVILFIWNSRTGKESIVTEKLPGVTWAQVSGEGLSTKSIKKLSGNQRVEMFYLEYGHCYRGVHICQNSLTYL